MNHMYESWCSCWRRTATLGNWGCSSKSCKKEIPDASCGEAFMCKWWYALPVISWSCNVFVCWIPCVHEQPMYPADNLLRGQCAHCERLHCLLHVISRGFYAENLKYNMIFVWCTSNQNKKIHLGATCLLKTKNKLLAFCPKIRHSTHKHQSMQDSNSCLTDSKCTS